MNKSERDKPMSAIQRAREVLAYIKQDGLNWQAVKERIVSSTENYKRDIEQDKLHWRTRQKIQKMCEYLQRLTNIYLRGTK